MLLTEVPIAFAISSPTTGAAALQTLARFLRLTLAQRQRPTDNALKTNSALESLERFKLLATKKPLPVASGGAAGDKSPLEITTDDDDDDDNDTISARLFRHVNSFLPALLTTLLTQLAATRSELLRQTTPLLCHVLLLDVASCWDTSPAAATMATSSCHYVSIAALECCLILKNDSNGRFRGACVHFV